jgi:hypothetical protein
VPKGTHARDARELPRGVRGAVAALARLLEQIAALPSSDRQAVDDSPLAKTFGQR